LRLRKKPHTDEKLKSFSDFVMTADDFENIGGHWREKFGGDTGRKLYVELGTGKGDFITQSAEKYPQVNFLGLEVEPTVVLAAARKIHEKKLSNVKLGIFDINNVDEIFDAGEVDRLYINFCDPWPKKRHAKRRLTYIKFLDMYRKILTAGGEIHFKTDNRALFDFSLEQFDAAGWKVRDVTFDLHADEPPENIRTEYENRFSALGVKINRCVAEKIVTKAAATPRFLS